MILAALVAAVLAGRVALGAQGDFSTLPPIGVAVEQDDGRWCAEFPRAQTPRITVGATVAIVFPDGAEALVWTTRIEAPREGECQSAFPQPRWDGYAAFSLDPIGAAASSAVAARKTVGLAVVTPAVWRRTAPGRLRADLDGDGLPEEALRCAADEGEHFTIWTVRSNAQPERLAHEYFDWGGLTDETCQPGEDGR